MQRFGGFGGGGANMQSLMKQAQKMQEEAQRAQEELEETEVEGISGGGMVSVVLNGAKTPVSVSIKEEAIDPDDKEMLEDLILVALKDASEKVDKLKAQKMGRFGGLI